MTDLRDTLGALDKEATQGEWVAHDLPFNGYDDPVIATAKQYIAQTAYDAQSYTIRPSIEADTRLIVALVNAYRAKQLVVVPDKEWLAQAVRSSVTKMSWVSAEVYEYDGEVLLKVDGDIDLMRLIKAMGGDRG